MAKNELTPSNAPQETKKSKIKHSHVSRNYNSFETLRFGEITPFFYDELVPNDKSVSVGCSVDVRSLNLKSPLMQDLTLSGRYFVVPYQCILPFNWERIFSNPTIGTDVPEMANCLFSPNWLSGFYRSDINSSISSDVTKWLYNLILELYLNDYVFSSSSVAALFKLPMRGFRTNLGGAPTISSQNPDFVVQFYNALVHGEVLFQSDNYRLNFYDDNTLTQTNYLVRLIDWVNSHPNYTILCGNPSVTDVVDLASMFSASRNLYVLPKYKFNMGLLYSYQLVCAHFYSNDFVDFVYSADLYKLAIKGIYDSIVLNDSSFNYNGISVPYDYLSGFYVKNFFDIAAAKPLDYAPKVFQWLVAVFRFNRSLKFEDYFVSLKTHPLAVGDTKVQPGEDGSVDIVDVSRSIQMQRFLNQVNRVGRKFEEYTKGIFGVVPAYDYHDPKHIGSFTINISSPETDNTSAAQLSEPQTTTSNFRGGTDTKRFSFDCDRFSYIIGLANFDISRSYVDDVTPLARRYDRFDFFNPYMQYIGDEEIPYCDYDLVNLNSKGTYDNVENLNDLPSFGYGVRNYPYKVRHNEVSESFVKYLPSWTFVDDNTLFREAYRYGGGADDMPRLSSDFIRCKVHELDPYFIQLSYLDFTQYFHFICSFFNKCEINRPMISAPQIIG